MSPEPESQAQISDRLRARIRAIEERGRPKGPQPARTHVAVTEALSEPTEQEAVDTVRDLLGGEVI